MATIINLFPARVRFVNADGTLTTEAYRALQSLVNRTGGVIGDQGVDLFGFVMGLQSDASNVLPPAQEAVTQPPSPPLPVMPMDWQGPSDAGFMADIIYQAYP